MKNIEVVIEPKGKVTQTVVLGAHYDTVETTLGADDNAYSVVVLLELAQRLKNLNSEHTRLRIVFFGNEPPLF